MDIDVIARRKQAHQRVGSIVQHLVEGRRDEALRVVVDYEEPMLDDFIDMGGWHALKAALVYRGLYPTWKERFPTHTLTEEQAQRVKAHLEGKGLL